MQIFVFLHYSATQNYPTDNLASSPPMITTIHLQDMKRKLSDAALNFLLYGGVMYTAGVPLFVRNRNLDHAIW
jgi:predicted membrane channel-forming protein YqfA (hemolysin III family)